MRKNLPVTAKEYEIGDDVFIVSRTDVKGRLTYFNDEFVSASGFTEDELRMQPHDIVRHPDMPPEAFQDLWDTIKAGKPWAGAVKNRRKNGDYYWVMASATPIWEHGKISGYMSIRSKLPIEQRKEAERIYALFTAGKAQGYRVEAGVVRRRSLFDYLSVFTGTLKARLGSLVALQSVFVIVMGLVGLMAAYDSNKRLTTIYEDRAVPLAQLFEINDRMKEASIMLYRAAVDGRAGKEVAEVESRIRKNSEAINKVWADYMATYLTPEEKVAADAFTEKRNTYREAGINAGLPLLAARKFDELAALQAGKASEALRARQGRAGQARRHPDRCGEVRVQCCRAQLSRDACGDAGSCRAGAGRLRLCRPARDTGDHGAAAAAQRDHGQHRTGPIQQPHRGRA